MTGRKFHDFWEFGNYETVEYGQPSSGKRKVGALCKICGTTLRNTAKLRMMGHRKICTPDKPLRFGDTTPVRVTLNKKINIKIEKPSEPDDVFNVTTYEPNDHEVVEPREPRGSGGRKFHDFWIEGMFRSVELPELQGNGKPKMGALCEICGSTMRNTAKARMMAHRNVCSMEKPMKYSRGRPSKASVKKEKEELMGMGPTIEMEVDMMDNFHTYSDDDLDLGNEEEDITPFGPIKQEPIHNDRGFDFVPMDEFPQMEEDNSQVHSMTDPTVPTVQIHMPTPPPKRAEVQRRVAVDKDSLDDYYAKFLFSTGAQYSTVDETHFKNLVKALNPSYKIPQHKTLLVSFLDKQYEKHFARARHSLVEESVLVMMDTRDSTLCILYSANGKMGFLGLFKRSENCEELYNKCKQLALENFNTAIYAVATNNPIFHVQDNIIILKNYSQIAIQLADCIISDDIIYDVNRAMEHFRHYQDLLIKHGGTPLQIIGTCSRRDFLLNFLENHGPMQKCLTMERTEPPSDFFNDFFGSEYIKGVKTVLDVSQQILDNLEKKTHQLHYSIADAVEDWISFQVPDAFYDTLQEFRRDLFDRISLAGNMLHPKYRGQRLSNVQKDVVDEFFLENLNVEGLDSFQNLVHKECIFETLLAKEISSPMTFWRMAQRKHPSLSEFATKLLNIPASFKRIEILLNNWINTHPEFDDIISIKTGKLIHFYLDLNYKHPLDNSDE